MQASSTDNPLSCCPQSLLQRKVPVRLSCVCRVTSRLHISCRTRPRVCMPTSQCKSSLVTGYFLFMWCGALVYKGTQRFGTLWLSGYLVWCCGLVLGWPSWEGEFEPPPPSRPPSWDRVGQMPGALGHTKRLLTWRPEEACNAFYHSALRGPFFIPVCCSWFPLSSSLKGVSVSLHQFLLSVPVSSVLPPLTQALRSRCSKMGWVQSSKISTKLLIYSYQTAFSFLTSWLMRSAPCMGISSIHCVIPIDPICSLVPQRGRGATKGLINYHTTGGSAPIAVYGL